MDAVRAASLLVVVLGHWLLAVVWFAPEGDLQVRTILATTPEVHWLTLVLQVMGAFFLVGGALSVRSWRRAREEAQAGRTRTRAAYADWLRSRAARLVGPVVPLMALWVALTPVLEAAGLPPELAGEAGTNALAPLWFLVVYLAVQALVPLIDAATTRIGWIPATGLLLLGSAVVDVLARGRGIEPAGFGGFLTVWVIPVVLGVALADDRLGPAQGRWLAGIGAAGVAVLIGLLDYPVLMVGTLPDGGSNQNPPSLALAALILCHVGLLLLTRERVTRWLAAPRARRVTEVLAAWSMPLFLWHMSAMSLAIGGALITHWATAGLLHLGPLTVGWWLSRPLWWIVLLVWTTPLIGIAYAYDRLPTGRGTRAPAAQVLASVAAAAAIGVGSGLVADPVVAVVSLVVLVGSAWALGALPARTRR